MMLNLSNAPLTFELDSGDDTPHTVRTVYTVYVSYSFLEFLARRILLTPVRCSDSSWEFDGHLSEAEPTLQMT